MSYLLRTTKTKKGDYLQMYETYWNKEKHQPRSRHIETFGYVCDLISDTMPDPSAYYQEYVAKKEEERKARLAEATRERRDYSKPIYKNIGYYIIYSLIEELGVKEIVDILSSVRQFEFSIYDMLVDLICARIVYPCSKLKTISEIFPRLYFRKSWISEDQVLDGCFFIGESYQKYIELFNRQYEKFFTRNYKSVYFDCTNYYFEIDLPKEDKQKGPSKENRHSPIIGQALLLDADMVPLTMQMYPGNESEKPYIRKMIEGMKAKYGVTGRTIQVADKGLNCARNIYAAVKEANDGYIFSKSVHGKNLSSQEKKWVLLENDQNVFTDYRDDSGQLLYRVKSCIDDYDYAFEDVDGSIVSFTVKEKRVVSYNPDLAKKQKEEITKMVEKARSCSVKENLKETLGDSVKYVTIVSKNKTGEKIRPYLELNQEKIEEDLKFAGYNLIVTSETGMTDKDIYSAYHNLWKIEESFRITKSFLDARPVYVQKKETIYGHFLVCYLGLFLTRVLELKCFKEKMNYSEIYGFIRDFYVVDLKEKFLNTSVKGTLAYKIRDLTGNNIIDALYFSEKELNGFFSNTMLLSAASDMA